MATNTPNLNLVKPDLTDPVDIDVLNGNMDILDARVGVGYRYVQTIYYTSSGTFVKANYPWLRAIRVRVQGGGGAGGGATTTGANQGSFGDGGGGGAYAESFITDIAGLDASVTVTRGNGGVGVSGAAGNNGTASTAFGLTANGGAGGAIRPAIATQVVGSTAPSASMAIATGGEIRISGGIGTSGIVLTPTSSIGVRGGIGGASVLSNGSGRTGTGANASTGAQFGGGGAGASNWNNIGTAYAGGAGANGIVIVDLFA